MSYSANCPDSATYFNPTTGNCVKCKQIWIKPGMEFTPNCGYTDDGGRRDRHIQECLKQTFNDGTLTKCLPCRICPQGHRTTAQCNSTTNTQCCQPDNCVEYHTSMATTSTWSNSLSTSKAQTSSVSPVLELCRHVSALFAIAFIVVAVILYFVCYRKSRAGKSAAAYKEETLPLENSVNDCTQGELDERKNKSTDSTNIINEEILLSFENNTFAEILKPHIQSAPLQTILDDFDVLDELVILLDPEINGVKNSRHLASRCCFSSAWITYTYSMKDSKSPFRAILEGLTTKCPDWTVGHIAQILSALERNDAIKVLTKLNGKV